MIFHPCDTIDLLNTKLISTSFFIRFDEHNFKIRCRSIKLQIFRSVDGKIQFNSRWKSIVFALKHQAEGRS